MGGSWTVFYNLTIISLTGAAAYIGSGEDSVFARHHPARPAVIERPAAEIVLVEAAAPTRVADGAAFDGAQTGIILASFSPDPQVTALEKPVEIESPLAATTAIVVGAAVNLRLGPSTDFDTIGRVVAGEELVLTGETDGTWVQVLHPIDGSPVWISQKFIN